MDVNQFSILHVEDDLVDSMVVERILKKQNICSVLYKAKNGVEALSMLRGNSHQPIETPDIILLDLNMPKMNGLEFLKELRGDDNLKTINVFVLTTSDDETDKQLAYKYNVAGYLLKPINAMEFENVFTVLKDFWTLSVKRAQGNIE